MNIELLTIEPSIKLHGGISIFSINIDSISFSAFIFSLCVSNRSFITGKSLPPRKLFHLLIASSGLGARLLSASTDDLAGGRHPPGCCVRPLPYQEGVSRPHVCRLWRYLEWKALRHPCLQRV